MFGAIQFNNIWIWESGKWIGKRIGHHLDHLIIRNCIIYDCNMSQKPTCRLLGHWYLFMKRCLSQHVVKHKTCKMVITSIQYYATSRTSTIGRHTLWMTQVKVFYWADVIFDVTREISAKGREIVFPQSSLPRYSITGNPGVFSLIKSFC
jgi:hypothetical protein